MKISYTPFFKTTFPILQPLPFYKKSETPLFVKIFKTQTAPFFVKGEVSAMIEGGFYEGIIPLLTHSLLSVTFLQKYPPQRCPITNLSAILYLWWYWPGILFDQTFHFPCFPFNPVQRLKEWNSSTSTCNFGPSKGPCSGMLALCWYAMKIVSPLHFLS